MIVAIKSIEDVKGRVVPVEMKIPLKAFQQGMQVKLLQEFLKGGETDGQHSAQKQKA